MVVLTGCMEVMPFCPNDAGVSAITIDEKGVFCHPFEKKQQQCLFLNKKVATLHYE